MLANILLIHVVIIFCNIFLPLLLTALSVNLVVLLTFSYVTVPPPQLLPVNHTFLGLTTTAVRLSLFPPTPQLLVAALPLCSTVRRTIKSLSFLSGIKLLVTQPKRYSIYQYYCHFYYNNCYNPVLLAPSHTSINYSFKIVVHRSLMSTNYTTAHRHGSIRTIYSS